MARDTSGTQNQPQYSSTGVPADAADLSEVANYAAAVGNRKVLTTTARNALSGADTWPGLVVGDLTDNSEYKNIAGSMTYIAGPVVQSGTTGVLRRGDLVTVHLSVGSPVVGTVLYTLPTGFTPTTQQIHPLLMTSGVGRGVGSATVDPSGAVTPLYLSATGATNTRLAWTFDRTL